MSEQRSTEERMIEEGEGLKKNFKVYMHVGKGKEASLSARLRYAAS